MSDWFQQNAPGNTPTGGGAPVPPPGGGGGGWFEKNAPSTTAAPPSIEQQLTQNPQPGVKQPEGVYRFIDTSKAPQDASDDQYAQWMKTAPVIYVPYSRALALLGHPEQYKGLTGEPASDWERLQQHVQTQIDMATNPMQAAGMGRQYVIHPDEVQSLYHDYQHDPNRASMRRGEFLSSLPPLQAAIGGAREATRTATFGGNIGPQGARKFAKTPQQNVFQQYGGGVEATGEFMGGEELIGALGKVLGYTPKLAEAAEIEEEIRKGTPAGELFKQALTAAGVSGTQTFLKTGGDIGATVKSATEMGALGIVGSAVAGTVEGVKGATAARAAEEARTTLDAQTKFADKMENYKWQKAKYDYDVEKRNWDEQKATIDAQHEQNVAAEQAKHDQEVARITAAHPEQVELQRKAHNQNIADLEALHERNVATAEAEHNQRLAEWHQQYKGEVATAYAQHQAAEQAKVTASKEARKAVQKSNAALQASAQQRAQTAATAAQQEQEAAAQAATEAQTKATAQKYGETAGAAIEPHLKAVEEAAQPRDIGAAIHGPQMAQFNTDEVLRRVGDYTGARTELQNSLNQTNEAMNEATDGRFTQVRDKVSAAQNKMYANESAENVSAYQQALKEMDDLIAGTEGRVSPELKDAVRKGWRQYYVLGDVANGLDKSVMGVPGDSALSQIYRGTDGKKLTDELSKAVIKHGRPAVADALGGEDRLKALEDIGRQTMNNGGRQKLNQVVVDVSKYLEPVEKADLPPVYKEAPFVKPQPTTPKPKFVEPKEPEGMKAKFKEPKLETPEFQEPAHPGYPAEPQKPAPRPPKEPTEPTPEEGKDLSAGKVARWAVKKTVGAMAWGLGYSKGGYTGGALAKSAAEAGMKATSAAVQKVQSAMVSDPGVARFLLFAARNPGDPKLYGPMIANMIVQSQQQEEENPDESNQTR